MQTSQVAAAAGSHMLASVPDGYAVRLYDIRTDSIIWAALQRSGDWKLRAWEAKPLVEEESCDMSPYGRIKPVADLADHKAIELVRG